MRFLHKGRPSYLLTQDDHCVRVQIPGGQDRKVILTSVMGCLSVTVMGAIVVVHFNWRAPNSSGLDFLSLLALFGIAGIVQSLFCIREETVEISDSSVVIEKRALRWKRSKSYDISGIENFQVNPYLRPDPNPFFGEFGAPHRSPYPALLFLHKGKRVYFGHGLDDDQGMQILKAIAGRYPHLVGYKF